MYMSAYLCTVPYLGQNWFSNFQRPASRSYFYTHGRDIDDLLFFILEQVLPKFIVPFSQKSHEMGERFELS